MLAKQKLAASAPVRPSLNTIEPFASLNTRWAEMTRREDKLTAELRPLVAEIRAAGGYAERGGVPARPSAGPEGYRPGVAELVADLVPFRRPDPAPVSDLDRRKARAAEISTELANITEAKRRLLPALNRARAEGSAAVCAAVRPDYAAIAQRIAAALGELGEAWTRISPSCAISRPRGFQLQPAADRDPRPGRPARRHRPRPALGGRVRLHRPERGAAGMASPLISHHEQGYER